MTFSSTVIPASVVSVAVGGTHTAAAGSEEALWSIENPQARMRLAIASPVFEIDGRAVTCRVADFGEPLERTLLNGVIESTFVGDVDGEPGLQLTLVIRQSPESPVVRFQYGLHSVSLRRLTKTAGDTGITYAELLRRTGPVTEVRMSDFVELGHSFMPNEITLDAEAAEALSPLIGPILVGVEQDSSWLLAYEHGTSGGDLFCGFWVDGSRGVRVGAVKGAYLDGQRLDVAGFRTPWLLAAAVEGGLDAVAAAFRTFLLRYQSEHDHSRRPQIFYNTWNFQERERYWHGRPYLAGLTEQRVLAELEVAARMGIDTYVIDTGWYVSTGDWVVNPVRFPAGLRNITDRADELGLRLGIWFDPTMASLSSRALAAHAGDIKTWRGDPVETREIWESETSRPMCLVSDWFETLLGHLIRVNRELGVTYFKLDAVGQYGCDSADHHHGDQSNSAGERADRFAFMMSERMTEIAERLAVAVPGSIVDFDVTENHRSFGLSFLSAGKYFLVNNGPYYSDYELPEGLNGVNTNMFFHPGRARGWICRETYAFDRWIPSVLTLVHYYPDDPCAHQQESLAAVILGHHGIWGDLLAISDEGVDVIRATLDRYRQVADDATRASMITTGLGAGAAEAREKILPETGRGVVSLFPPQGQAIRHVTAVPVDTRHWAAEGIHVSFLPDGRAVIDATRSGSVIFG
ncbi:alpha-galactosidase [Agromyces sp. SYSU K20354]|uniref:alpha-galactosidase n=1 Tax=Agromyces cavernae TaxID=2898659 RepID=UPI001E2F8904|nr:alpha-galactosidase [Agromyces cavernae]MCD2443376.1 alpha-galactosidase [Agromyces cavernae]